MDLALLQVMREGLLRRSETSALRCGGVELHENGSGRLHVARSKTDQSAEGAVLCLGPERRGCGVAGADDRREAGQSSNAGQVHGGPADRQRRGGSVLQRRPLEMSLNRSDNHWPVIAHLLLLI